MKGYTMFIVFKEVLLLTDKLSTINLSQSYEDFVKVSKQMLWIVYKNN